MLEQSVNRALALHQSGKLEEAEGLYALALKEMPGHPELLHMYGVLQQQRGNSAPAIEYISRAIKANPRNASFHNNLGEVYRLARDLSRAVESFRKAIGIDPKYVEAHRHLGNVLLEAGRPREAMTAYRNALALAPGHVQTWQLLAIAADQAGENAAALEAFEGLVKLRPEDVESQRNRAILLVRLGQFDEAAVAYERAMTLAPGHLATHFGMVDCLEKWRAADGGAAAVNPLMEAAYRRILDVDPGHVETQVRLGTLLVLQDRAGDGLHHLRRAAELSPKDALVLLHLGNALQRVPQMGEAIATYQAALEIDSTIARLHADLSSALAAAGRLDEALAAAERAIGLDAALAGAWNNKAAILQDLGRAGEAVEAFAAAAELAPDNAAIGSNLLYAQHYLPGDAAMLLGRHKAWAERFAGKAGGRRLPRADLPGSVSQRPLRVGLVSGDFKNHSVARFVEPLLANMEAQRVVVACYSNVPLEDEVTAKLRSLAPLWRPITGVPDAVVAEQIQNDRIDILIDLSGHTAHNRLTLMARRAAPLQMTWLGYPDTTGLAEVDYRITDCRADLECAADGAVDSAFHTEKLLALPTAWCYQPPANAPEVVAPPSVSRGFVTFACFNNFLKVTPEMMGIWARILQALPQSRLLLKAGALGNVSVRGRVLEAFAGLGVSPLRVDLRPVERDAMAHLAMYHQADIALDTFPYAGTATTCEALWMGLPVVTLAGARHVSRVGVSLLTSVGLPNCIAENPDEYVRIATQLAGDLGALAERRAGLRQRMGASRLCDGKTFAEAFTDMLERVQSGALTTSTS